MSTSTSRIRGSDGPVPVLEIEILPMRRRHLRSVLRIEGQSVQKGWSSALFMGELAYQDGRLYVVAKSAGQVVGFGGMMFVGDEGHVTTISVDEAWQRRRIGTRLMLALTRHAIGRGATALTLEVRAGNEAAQAMYRRFGFVPVGVRRNYYADIGEDALVMWAHDVGTRGYEMRLGAIERSIGAGGAGADGARTDGAGTGPRVATPAQHDPGPGAGR